MKRYLNTFFLFLILHFLSSNASAQYAIYSSDTNSRIVIWAEFNLSKSKILYINENNQFSIKSKEYISRELILVTSDTVPGEFSMEWVAHSDIAKTRCIRLTLDSLNAVNWGGYYPLEELDSQKYKDTNNLYWEKEYTLIPKTEKDYTFQVYHVLNDTLQEYYCTINIHSTKLEMPVLDLSYEMFLALDHLNGYYGHDYKLGYEWFKINTFTFSALDKRGRIVYTQKCFGNLITPEMKAAITDKKTRTVRLDHIKSKRFEYNEVIIHKP